MKIEAAIVARPRFQRVPGKLNCTAENCPGREARGILRGKQLGRTNFQFNRSSEWPAVSKLATFVSALSRLRRYCRHSWSDKLSSLLKGLCLQDIGTNRKVKAHGVAELFE